MTNIQHWTITNRERKSDEKWFIMVSSFSIYQYNGERRKRIILRYFDGNVGVFFCGQRHHYSCSSSWELRCCSSIFTADGESELAHVLLISGALHCHLRETRDHQSIFIRVLLGWTLAKRKTHVSQHASNSALILRWLLSRRGEVIQSVLGRKKEGKKENSVTSVLIISARVACERQRQISEA